MYLHCRTHYSLLHGTLSPKELVEHAIQTGAQTLVLSDINNTSAWLDFYKHCTEAGIKPLFGIEFRNEQYQPLYQGIARTNEGIYQLNKFLSSCLLHGKKLPARAPELNDVYFVYRLGSIDANELKENEWIGICPWEVPLLLTSEIRFHTAKLVALHPVTFQDSLHYKIHGLLRCIDQNTTMHKLDKSYISLEREQFVSKAVFQKNYELFPALMENTEKLLQSCEVHVNLKQKKNKKTFTGSKDSDYELLYKKAYSGLLGRYGEENFCAIERFEKEMKIIRELDFLAYFLITDDLLEFARSRNFYHVGRGSGANSIVAYCLGITDVNPIDLDLYFERFINPQRSSPPDFDIDFCWNERDEVIQYIFNRYGEEHVCLLATYTTFQTSSAVRELGKVVGLPKEEIDKMLNPLEEENFHPASKLVTKYCPYLTELPQHLSIHAGGILITEESLYQYTALQMMPKGFPINQFDMHVAEENGFDKLDVLSQRGLGHIKDAVNWVLKNQNIHVDIHRVEDFKIDENIRRQLKSAKTIGAFYIESPAMRGLLSKLRCDNYLSLVAASSIIRPGVAESGMMREYIRRFHQPETVHYLHPVFEEHLKETFGVMVYQEDVIKIAHHFAGLELSEADILRRMMSGKSRGKAEAQRIYQKFFDNCQKKGYTEDLAQEVWRQIESFSGYSFCKAHSASYAVESYQSLFLKTYFPLEFMVGVINNFGGFYDTELYVHEARMCGASIEGPCINQSEYLTSIQGKVIYLGFIHIKGMEESFAKRIVKERSLRGPYTSLGDFIERTQASREQLTLLIRIQALRFTGLSRRDLMWAKNSFRLSAKHEQNSGMLFQELPSILPLPALEDNLTDTHDDELELLGFPLCSPFELAEDAPQANCIAENLVTRAGTWVKIKGYYITKKVVRTKRGDIMNFGTWIDEKGMWFDTTHFSKSLDQFPFRGKGVYLIEGKVVLDFDFPMIEVSRMHKLPRRTNLHKASA
ncbi:MAG: DNA polymerase III subunit alpha [Cytophagaceae bacterium]|jgi:DNA polymerase-3 subunit alpha|nr:DNA polymerase III subunit alpha [Cytophagaceae bacterium]